MTGPGPLLNALQMQWDDFFIFLRHREENSGVIFIFKHRLPCSQSWCGSWGVGGWKAAWYQFSLYLKPLSISGLGLHLRILPLSCLAQESSALTSGHNTEPPMSSIIPTTQHAIKETYSGISTRQGIAVLVARFASPSRREPQNPPSTTPSLWGY